MTRIDKVLQELSDLYKFNRKIKAYDLKKQPANRWRNAEKKDDAIETPVHRDNLRVSRPWIKSSASVRLSAKDRGFDECPCSHSASFKKEK